MFSPSLAACGGAAAPPTTERLTFYGMMAEIGTIACRETRDARGDVVRRICYTAPLAAWTDSPRPPRIAEGDLVVQSVEEDAYVNHRLRWSRRTGFWPGEHFYDLAPEGAALEQVDVRPTGDGNLYAFLDRRTRPASGETTDADGRLLQWTGPAPDALDRVLAFGEATSAGVRYALTVTPSVGSSGCRRRSRPATAGVA